MLASSLRAAGRARPLRSQARRVSDGLPYRIRAPLAKLQQQKKAGPKEGVVAAALIDGEALEYEDVAPDYVRLALTSRVYDFVRETPLHFASGLSHRLGAQVHLKREDTLPSFSFKLRGAYNLLAHLSSKPKEVVTYSVGSQGHSMAVAARALGLRAHVVMPARTPSKRVAAIERAGAVVSICGSSLEDAKLAAKEMAREKGAELIEPHDHPLVIAGQATAGLELVKQIGAPDTAAHLDAVFVVAGGSSLLAGVA